MIQLTPGEHPSHEIDIAADSAAELAMTPETEMHFRRLVAETGALFGVRHYRDYHFLVTLSDDVAHFGLEHHESSDDRHDARSLIDDEELVDFSRACCPTNSSIRGTANTAARRTLPLPIITSR